MTSLKAAIHVIKTQMASFLHKPVSFVENADTGQNTTKNLNVFCCCVCLPVCSLGVTSSTQSVVSVEGRMPDIPWILHTGSHFCLWTQPCTSSEWKSTDSAQTQWCEGGSSDAEWCLIRGFHSNTWSNLQMITKCTPITPLIFVFAIHSLLPSFMSWRRRGFLSEQAEQLQTQRLYSFCRDPLHDTCFYSQPSSSSTFVAHSWLGCERKGSLLGRKRHFS